MRCSRSVVRRLGALLVAGIAAMSVANAETDFVSLDHPDWRQQRPHIERDRAFWRCHTEERCGAGSVVSTPPPTFQRLPSFAAFQVLITHQYEVISATANSGGNRMRVVGHKRQTIQGGTAFIVLSVFERRDGQNDHFATAYFMDGPLQRSISSSADKPEMALRNLRKMVAFVLANSKSRASGQPALGSSP